MSETPAEPAAAPEPVQEAPTPVPSATAPVAAPTPEPAPAPAEPLPAQPPESVHKVRLADAVATVENFFARNPLLEKALLTDLTSGLKALERFI